MHKKRDRQIHSRRSLWSASGVSLRPLKHADLTSKSRDLALQGSTRRKIEGGVAGKEVRISIGKNDEGHQISLIRSDIARFSGEFYNRSGSGCHPTDGSIN